MKRQVTLGYLLVVIMLVVLPSATSLSLYAVTKNPNIRPLGITEKALNAYYGVFGDIEIRAIVAWDAGRAGQMSQAQLRRALQNAFRAKGVEAMVSFVGSTRGTYVTYRVGATTLGPYPQSRAAEGIGQAVEAFRMYVPYQP